MSDVMPPAPPAAAAGARQGECGAGCCAGGDAEPYSAPAALVWSAAFSAFLVSVAAPELIFSQPVVYQQRKSGLGNAALPPQPSASPAAPWASPQSLFLATEPKTTLEIALFHLWCLLGEETDNSLIRGECLHPLASWASH